MSTLLLACAVVRSVDGHVVTTAPNLSTAQSIARYEEIATGQAHHVTSHIYERSTP